MPKEITFAILIGFILGLLITFGIYTANKAVKEQTQQVKTENSVIPTPSPANSEVKNVLTISGPADEKLFNDPAITISGKTNPKAAIAILWEENEVFVEADPDGFFSQDINLAAGVNSVTIVSTDSFGSQAEEKLTLTYSTKVKNPAQKQENKTDETN